MDLFIIQADGKKVVDPNKQNALCSRLQMELLRPLRVAVVSRGPDTELLVANPVELAGNGRPLVFFDITHALKRLDVCIFSVLLYASINICFCWARPCKCINLALVTPKTLLCVLDVFVEIINMAV